MRAAPDLLDGDAAQRVNGEHAAQQVPGAPRQVRRQREGACLDGAEQAAHIAVVERQPVPSIT